MSVLLRSYFSSMYPTHNITVGGLHAVPRQLLNAVCLRLYIEVMPPLEGHEDSPNLVFFKIDLSRPAGATIPFKSVRLGMIPDYPQLETDGYVPGALLTLSLGYELPGPRVCRAFAFTPLSRQLTLEHILRPIIENRLQHFEFDMRHTYAHGYRDFIYQAFSLLIDRGYFERSLSYVWPEDEPLIPGPPTIKNILGKQFDRDGRPRDEPISKGYFRSYVRINDGIPPYVCER
ncbi:hypothetical protein F5Y13DRAFT_185883 [Hypoxylon sp. FL1857]|nr:hypothetical protein F5Y13DRAFT_185883 [Hypoxylon sp. FL1857]